MKTGQGAYGGLATGRHPISGLPEIGIFICASRLQPTCVRRPMTGSASSAVSDRGDNALQLAGDGFGDRLQRRISNMLHGYGRVDGGDLDPGAADILHDDVT